MEGRKRDSEFGSVQLSRFGKAGRNLRRNPKGERRQDILSLEDEVIKKKSDRAKDIEEDTISGDNSEGVPPVPIPNTEVKPFSVDGTWLETARESRSSPDSNNTRQMASVFLC